MPTPKTAKPAPFCRPDDLASAHELLDALATDDGGTPAGAAARLARLCALVASWHEGRIGRERIQALAAAAIEGAAS